MKRIIKIIVLALITAAATGCYGKIIDWYPVEFKFYVEDNSGNDLLDPESDRYIGKGAKAEWRGEEYELSPETKALDVRFHGFVLKKDNEGKHYAYFGELGGGHNYNDELTLTWADCSTDILLYKRRINSMTVNANEKRKLNGKKIAEKGPITIVKDK